jgi:hypothetical protein
MAAQRDRCAAQHTEPLSAASNCCMSLSSYVQTSCVTRTSCQELMTVGGIASE